MIKYVFFFSSRRRHTSYWRDWSSDVCSSDLLRAPERLVGVDVAHARHPLLRQEERLDGRLAPVRHAAQRLGREIGSERLDADAPGEVVVHCVVAEQDDARAEAPRIAEQHVADVFEVDL